MKTNQLDESNISCEHCVEYARIIRVSFEPYCVIYHPVEVFSKTSHRTLKLDCTDISATHNDKINNMKMNFSAKYQY